MSALKEMGSESPMTMLIDTASHMLELAKSLGAEQADVAASRGTEFEVKVADGEIVTLTQATSKGLGLRVFVGNRMGFCTTSDFNRESLKHAAERAVAMAKEAAPDPHNGLADAEPGTIEAGADLDLYDAKVVELLPETKIEWAHAMEAAARQVDPSVSKFRDSGVASGDDYSVLVTSTGAIRSSRSTGISLWCNPLATKNGELQTEFWYDSRTHLEDLEAVESIGRIAGERAFRMLGAKPIKTQKCPVIFEPAMAAGLVSGILGAIDGDMVYKKASFLTQKLGEHIAVPGLSLIDDPLQPRGVGSTPFDGEGLKTSRKALLDQGALTTFLYDNYTARKAGVKPTANARRGYSSMPHPGCFNVFVPAGTDDAAAIIKNCKRGLLLTRSMGRGLDIVSGEYSKGANGLWIENGEIVHPVQEVTIAGNFIDMLLAIDAIGNDFQMRGARGAPTLRLAEMTVSGT